MKRILFILLATLMATGLVLGGCDEDDDGTTDTGTEDTGNSDATQDATEDVEEDTSTATTDLCQDEANLGIISTLEGNDDDSDDPSEVARACALGGCLNEADPGQCAADCVAEETGLSTECSGCFGDIVVCSIDNCLSPCLGSDVDACTQCQIDAGCLGPYYACTGFDAPEETTEE